MENFYHLSYCDVCDVVISGLENYQNHLVGKRHLNKIQGNNTFLCETCNVVVCGIDNYKLHLNGKKHIKLVNPQ